MTSWKRSVVLLSLLALVLPAAGGAGYPSGEEIPLDPEVIHGKLKNGLTYYIRTNAKPENRANVRLVVNAGSVLEDEDQRGLAHFVEHMAFNGTYHFAKQDLVDYLESVGMAFGPDVNAYTSFDETVYMLEVPTDDEALLRKAFLILEDWAHRVSFEAEEIEKERGVIMEEWRLGRGAGARVRDKQFPILFKDSRYAERLAIGLPEIIEGAPPEAVRRFYRDWYRPELMAIIAVGDFNPKRVEGWIRHHFSRIKGRVSPRPREVFPVPDHRETLFAIATDPEMTSTRVGVTYKMDKRSYATIDDMRRQLIEGLYHRMLNDRLGEIRQRPDPPFLSARSSTGGFVRSKDSYSLSARVEEGGVDSGLGTLLTEVDRVEAHGFNQSELDRARTDMLRGFEQAMREKDKRYSSSFVWQYTSHFLRGRPAPSLEYAVEKAGEILPAITLEEVNRLARNWITSYNRVITYTGPEKEDAPPPTEEDLLAVFQTPRGVIAPWVDRVRDEPLVAEIPAPGTIVEESEIEELGVTVWKLSNGIRVVMKPTDFQNDQFLFAGFSPGGHSLAPDAQHTSANYATGVLARGGLGEFDLIELAKALTGKVVNARSYIGELEEGVRGSASPEDIETMFQLLYLKITAPRMDEEAFQSWLTRSRAAIRNRLASPGVVFGDKWQETITQGHYRRRPSSLEKLDEIDLQTAYKIHKERFRDCGDMIFTFVGNFEPEEIKPYVLTWLGGLPATGRKETWRDVEVEFPEGVVEFEVRKGLEPKSRVRIRFASDAEWSREQSHRIGSLASVLRIRLREILREDMGGTYGVGVGGWISRRPRQEAGFQVSFGCAPESVEPMVKAVFEEIERIKSEGIDQRYVDKVKESQVRRREIALKENGFWLSALEGSYTYGDDPLLILTFDELVDLVTPEALQGAARRYIDTGHYVKGVLYPEEGAEAGGGGSR